MIKCCPLYAYCTVREHKDGCGHRRTAGLPRSVGSEDEIGKEGYCGALIPLVPTNFNLIPNSVQKLGLEPTSFLGVLR